MSAPTGAQQQHGFCLPLHLLAVECGAPPCLNTLAEVSVALPRSFSAEDQAGGNALSFLLQLQAATASKDARGAREALQGVSAACEFLSPGLEARKSPAARRAQRGIACTGGWTHLVGVLDDSWDSLPSIYPALLADLRVEAAAILRELCYIVPGLGEQVAASPGLCARIFRLACTQSLLTDVCTALLEELLPLRATMLDLSTEIGDDLQEMLLNQSAPQLASLCRAMLGLVYQSDAQSLAAPEEDALVGVRTLGPRLHDDNHGAILAVPQLIGRLVQLLRLRPLPPFVLSANQQHHWRLMAYLTRAMPQGADSVLPRLMALLTASPQPTWDDTHVQADTMQPGERLAAVARISLTDGGVEATGGNDEDEMDDALPRPCHHGDVLFLLCTLMQGAHKAAAQDAIMAAGFPATARLLFDCIDWESPDHDADSPAGGLHGPNCTCSARSALRVQFLRCLHAFIERDGSRNGDDADARVRVHKLSLLSADEIAQFYPHDAAASCTPSGGKSEGDSAASPKTPGRTRGVVAAARQRLSQCMTRSTLWMPSPSGSHAAAAAVSGPAGPAPEAQPSAPGLMTKLIKQFMTTGYDASHCFWLASCVDAYLRAADAADQHYVASTGILRHLVREVLTHDRTRPPGSLQAVFDILAELVKFNAVVWEQLQDALEAESGDAAMRRLVAIVMSHLVDTNMLIRAGYLSMNSLRMADEVSLQEPDDGDADMADIAVPLRCEEPSRRLRAATAAAAAAAQAAAEACNADSVQPLCMWMGGGSCARNVLFAWLTDNWLDVLAALVDAVPAAELDSECVCTVNTALVMLLLARRAGRLARCLQALSQRSRSEGDPRLPLCVALDKTLRVWVKSYFSACPARDKDRWSLEDATGMPFSEFHSLVNALLGEPSSPVALLHYVQ